MSSPMWIVWHPDGGEDGPEQGRRYRAMDAEHAAEEWAKDYDEGDYPLTRDESRTEVVKVAAEAGDSTIYTYEVRAVISTDYYADELEAQR